MVFCLLLFVLCVLLVGCKLMMLFAVWRCLLLVVRRVLCVECCVALCGKALFVVCCCCMNGVVFC